MRLTGFTVLALLILLAIAFLREVRHQVKVMHTYGTAKTIAGFLINYAGDNQGIYPDSAVEETYLRTSNDAFRLLFSTEYVMTHPFNPRQPGLPPTLITNSPHLEDPELERLFGCHDSPHQPDGILGTCPDYLQTLGPGENHWALVAGLSTTHSSHHVLFMEDPADPSWPPRWNTDLEGQPLPGRSWNRRRIFIMRNDGSGDFYKLAPGPGLQPIAPDANGKSPFDRLPHEIKNDPFPRILDVED